MQNQNIEIETKLEDDSTLVAFLKGEIDHHTAAKIRSLLDIKIESIHPKLLVLDFTQITFMDSSGIGLVMGRYKTICELSGELAIVNTSPSIGKVMRLAGMERLAKIGMESSISAIASATHPTKHPPKKPPNTSKAADAFSQKTN